MEKYSTSHFQAANTQDSMHLAKTMQSGKDRCLFAADILQVSASLCMNSNDLSLLAGLNLKGNGYVLRGDNLVRICFASFLKGVQEFAFLCMYRKPNRKSQDYLPC